MYDYQQLFVAMSALVVAVGSQAVVKDTGKFLSEVVVPHPVSKTVIIFCMFFLTTRDWSLALFCATAYFVLVRGLLDERHPLSVVSAKSSSERPIY